jgi:hypothetical protein
MRKDRAEAGQGRKGRRRALAVALGIACVGAALWAASPAQAALPRLTLNVGPSSIAVGGATQSGGVEIVTSTGIEKGAEATLFRLDPGTSASELEAFLRSKRSRDPNEAGRYGSIVFSSEAFPGHPGEAQTELAPGEYVALAGPGHGPPKLAQPFTVSAAAAPAALPEPRATIRSIDFDFRGPATLHEGELVRFENEGFLVHMDIALPVKGRAAARRVAHGMLSGRRKGLSNLFAGPPVGFQGAVSHGAFQQERIAARPGWYVQVCFMEDQEGAPHTQLGMVRPIRIVK